MSDDARVERAAVALALELGHTMVSVRPMRAGPNTKRIAATVLAAADAVAHCSCMWEASRGEPPQLVNTHGCRLHDPAIAEVPRLRARVEQLEAVASAAQHWLDETGPGMHVNTAVGRQCTRAALAALSQPQGEGESR